ncbi:ATP-binding protein [Pseudomonas sp. Z1-29]|uniref:ATP-binding protein n=1 Tax=Pseudomonas sp. Z1-29 TaxID=2817410 RepID=UPI003DA81396
MPEPLIVIEEPKGDFHEFTVDAALFRELGERLVGKPHVALAELVKNSYDAEATEVTIEFKDDSIIVADNGDGMSKNDFINYWLRVGTTHKQERQVTANLNRSITGSKGVGRLSAQFLGDVLTIETVKRNEREFVEATVNWSNARGAGEMINAGAFIDTSQHSSLIYQKYPNGTCVKIEGLKQIWSSDDLRELAKELWFLRPPAKLMGGLDVKDQFDVIVKGLPDEDIGEFSRQMNKALDNWIAIIEGSLEDGRGKGETNVTVTFKNGDVYEASFEPSKRVLDEVKFKIFVFKLSGKQAGDVKVGDAREYFKKFGGVHIYDNSFRLPFYGGGEQDWLQLEIDHSHRLNKSQLLPANLQVSSGLNDLPTNGRIFGVSQISTSHERSAASYEDVERGNYLNVQVTRDRLIDNLAFDELERSVRWAIDFYAMRSFERRQMMKNAARLDVPKTEQKISEIREGLFQLSLKVPDSIASEIEVVSNRFKELEDLEGKRRAALNEERVLLGALATTGMAAIALEHELGKELTALNDIILRLSNNTDAVSLGQGSELLAIIRSWADRSAKARKLFSPLMSQYDREGRNKYNAQKVLKNVINNSEALLRNVSVSVERVSKTVILPEGTLAAWNAIFQNVLINSINAMIDSDVKEISCFGENFENGRSVVYVMDTGVGVRLHDSADLFKPFIRRLEIPDERKALGLGGVGLGLTIVKMVADSLGCDVSFAEPLPGFKTAFKIEWFS